MTTSKESQDRRPAGPELENVDPLTGRVFHALGRIIHLNRLAISRMCAQHGIQHAEAFALPLLVHHEGISQRELGQVLHLSPPRVSMILRALEAAGSVAREPDGRDRRVTRVFLTPEGRQRESERRAGLGSYVNRTIGALSEEDRIELARLLGKLADRTQEVLAKAGPGEEGQTR